jgi:hypothetical protein
MQAKQKMREQDDNNVGVLQMLYYDTTNIAAQGLKALTTIVLLRKSNSVSIKAYNAIECVQLT